MNLPHEVSAAAGTQPCLRVGAPVTLLRQGGAAPQEFIGKGAVVLAWVALEGHVERRRLAAALWPESDLAQARANLRVLVHRINQRSGAELLVGTESLSLDGSVLRLETHDADGLLAALRVGGAEHCRLLAAAGVEAEAGEALLAWLGSARERLRRAQLATLSEALAEATAGADHERTAALARACVQLDPLSEPRHRQLMDVLVRAGDRAAALNAYEDCKQLLQRHLGVLPELRTRTLHVRLLQEQAQAAAPSAMRRPHKPAAQAPEPDGLTALGGAARYALVERDAELAQGRAALEQGQHVVLHGEPGVGKTRLLRHLAVGFGPAVESLAIRSGIRQEPYAALAQWLQDVQTRRAPGLGVPEQIELARLAPLAFADVQPSEAPLSAPRLHAALRHWVVQLAAVGVRLLVLDDVQGADAASQAAFAALLAAPVPGSADNRPTPALLLGHRSGELDAVLQEALVAAQVQRRARFISLQRLSLAGVSALLHAIDAGLSVSQQQALAQQLLKRTGGNPLFVIELAQQTAEHGDAADSAGLQALMGLRLQGCSTAAQQLAAVAAVAGDDFTVELAAAVTGQPALGLMPAWAELQDRGLFAGHGLAHDLVQDAVLVGLPQAIVQTLHGQAARHLEQQGQRGSSVLRHWLAADNAEHALPHALHQVYAMGAAGLPTQPQELQIVALLERCSDTALMSKLWFTAEVEGGLGYQAQTKEVWMRLRALRLRAEGLPPQPTSAAWIAFETARDHYNLGNSAKAAWEALAPAAALLPERGVERAWVELWLMTMARNVGLQPQPHMQRALAALEGLPAGLPLKRVRTLVDVWSSAYLNPAEGLRALAQRRRSAQRRGDQALVAHTCASITGLHGVRGNLSRAYRHHARVAITPEGEPNDVEGVAPIFAGRLALATGRYAVALRCLAAQRESAYGHWVPILRALLYLQLGDVRQAREHQGRIDTAALGRPLSNYLLHAQLRARLDELEGRDALPALRQWLSADALRAQGVSGITFDRFSWPLAQRSLPAAERLQVGHALLEGLRQSQAPDARSTMALASLEVAEAHELAAVPGAQALATQAARAFRRGYAPEALYLPEALLRCARLIEPNDPREAAALVHVARRWVRHALQHLPAGAEDGFVRHVVVNRLLLGDDEQAVYGAPLRPPHASVTAPRS